MSVYENDDYLGSETKTLAEGEGRTGTPRVVNGRIFRKRHDSFRQEPSDNGEFWVKMKEQSNDNICTLTDGQDELTLSEKRLARWATCGELGYGRPPPDGEGEVCGPGLVVVRESNQRMPANTSASCGGSDAHIKTLFADIIDQETHKKNHKASNIGSHVNEKFLRAWAEAAIYASRANGSDYTLEFTNCILDKADQQGAHERAIYTALNGLLLSPGVTEKMTIALGRLVLKLPGAEYGEALEVSHGHDGTWTKGRARLVCVGYVRVNNPVPGPEIDLLLSNQDLDGVTRSILHKREEQAPLRLYNIEKDQVESLGGKVTYAALSYVWKQWTADELKRELRKLSSHSGIQYAWVDAWCINQQDIQEKEKEISKMASYYQGSSLTLALLPDYEPPWALQGRGLAHPVMPNGLGCQLERWRQVTWNTRVWTLQEAALSANVVLRTKQGYMNLQTAEVVAESCGKMFSARPAALYSGSRREIFQGAAAVTPPEPRQHLRSYHWETRVDTSQRRMRDVVTIAAGRKCQEVADQIFGLAALAEGEEKLEVDYSRDVDDIVAAAFQKWKIPPLTLFAPTVASAPGSCWQAGTLADVSSDVIRRLGHWEDGIVLSGKAIVLPGRPITATPNGRLKYGHIGTDDWRDLTEVGDEGELLCATQWDQWVLAIPGYISGPMTWHRTGPATLSGFTDAIDKGMWKIGQSLSSPWLVEKVQGILLAGS